MTHSRVRERRTVASSAARARRCSTRVISCARGDLPGALKTFRESADIHQRLATNARRRLPAGGIRGVGRTRLLKHEVAPALEYQVAVHSFPHLSPASSARRCVAVLSLFVSLGCLLTVAGRPALGAAGQVGPSFGASLGLRGNVTNILPAPGGKIYVVGGFQRLVRLNPDGTFALPSNITFSSALSITVQPDGLLLLWNGVLINGASKSLIRLKLDGTLDPTLASPTVSTLPSGGSSATLSSINAVVVQQSTSKIVIAGGFNRVNGQSVLAVQWRVASPVRPPEHRR